MKIALWVGCCWALSEAVRPATLFHEYRNDAKHLYASVSDGITHLSLKGLHPPSVSQFQNASNIFTSPGPRKLSCTSLISTAAYSRTQHGKQCDYLTRSVVDQLGHVFPSAAESPLAWTIIDQNYATIAKHQEQQLKNAGFNKLLFVSVDPGEGLARELCETGLAVIDYRPEFQTLRNKSGEEIPWTVKLRVAKAKFGMPGVLLQRGIDNLFTEMDIFWLQDPMLEFRAVGPRTMTPSLVFGAHTNNPWSINIGTWYMRGDSSPNAARVFEEAFEILGNYSTTENKDKPYDVFDQQVLQKLLAVRTSLVNTRWKWPSQGNDKTCAPSMHWCFELSNRSTFEDVLVRVLDNFRIASSITPEYDEGVLAVHVNGMVPLQAADAKVRLAKLMGVFHGVPEYYEQVSSRDRYIAWEGFVKSSDEANTYARTPSITSRLMPILLKLGIATGRVVILPMELDINNKVWFGEQLFDETQFQKSYSNLSVGIRESTFLHNNRLAATHMYPISQLTVAPSRWAGVKTTRASDQSPTSTYFSIGDGDDSATYMHALVHMMQEEQVQAAKTVVLNFPVGWPGDGTTPSIASTEYEETSCRTMFGNSLESSTLGRLFCMRKGDEKSDPLSIASLCSKS